jgi:hypothetical protein
MLNTTRYEIVGAAVGATVGVVFPLVLHILASHTGDTEVCGMPMAVFSLPGFFAGAITGAQIMRKRA